jgi:hypothetical protein
MKRQSLQTTYYFLTISKLVVKAQGVSPVWFQHGADDRSRHPALEHVTRWERQECKLPALATSLAHCSLGCWASR